MNNITISHLNAIGFEIARPNKLKTKPYTRDLIGKLTEHYKLSITRFPFKFKTDIESKNYEFKYLYFDEVKFTLWFCEDRYSQRYVKEFEVSGTIEDLKKAYEKIYKEALELEFKRFIDFRK